MQYGPLPMERRGRYASALWSDHLTGCPSRFVFLQLHQLACGEAKEYELHGS
jgi:hypothetical protein